MFNIHPLDIKETKVLIIGSKKKVGEELTPFLKKHHILYGRVKNRFHINLTNPDIFNLLFEMNFEIIIDLSNDASLNYLLTQNLSHCHIIRTLYKREMIEPQLRGITILSDPIFQPKFYPNAMHHRQKSDLNYYIFDKYINQGKTNHTISLEIDKNQTYTSSSIIAKEIFHHLSNALLLKREEIMTSTIDLRSNSKSAYFILNQMNQNNEEKYSLFKEDDDPHVSLEDVKIHFSELKKKNQRSIYVSHVTIVSGSPNIISRYETIVSACDKALNSFYDLLSVEFICVTNVQNHEISKKFEFLKKYETFQKHQHFIIIPEQFIDEISSKYRINYFPEYFLRNIGIRRSKGRYLLSGSCDVFMPPQFFLSIQKHLFCKNYLIRSNRNDVSSDIISETRFEEFYQKYVKESYYRNKIVNLIFDRPCNMPCNPQNRNCGDFQGFHRHFWYKLNGYYNSHYNFNVDSLLSYHLLGMFSPIIYKLMYGELHYGHQHVSSSTPGLPNSIYCNAISVEQGIYGKYNGTSDWGFPQNNFREYSFYF